MDRLPAHLEAASLLRRAETSGGFGMVLHRGDRERGAILIVLQSLKGESSLCERLPQLNGAVAWSIVSPKNIVTEEDLKQYLTRRTGQDADLWVLELTVADVERFVSEL